MNDLWRELKKANQRPIPIFSGNKHEAKKAAFMACLDTALTSAEYKLFSIVQASILRQYPSGQVLKVIESLGHSVTAYQAAKEILEKKYGAKRRKVALSLEEVDRFQPIRDRHAKDMEKFAGLLHITVINLCEAGYVEELSS